MAENTAFSAIYDNFFTRVTDDMYMEWTREDTEKDLQNMLIAAIPTFEFPRFDIFDYTLGELVNKGTEEEPHLVWDGGSFNTHLTIEETNILALSMMIVWFTRQMATVEHTKIKSTGSDFKMSSQANHLAKLSALQDKFRTECFHQQRLYKRRRRTDDGQIQSTMGDIMTTPSYGWKI